MPLAVKQQQLLNALITKSRSEGWSDQKTQELRHLIAQIPAVFADQLDPETPQGAALLCIDSLCERTERRFAELIHPAKAPPIQFIKGLELPEIPFGAEGSLVEFVAELLAQSVQHSPSERFEVSLFFQQGDLQVSIAETKTQDFQAQSIHLLAAQLSQQAEKMGLKFRFRSETRLGCLWRLTFPGAPALAAPSDVEELRQECQTLAQSNPQMAQVLQLALGSLKQDLVSLGEAVAQRDRTQAARQTHKLRGFPAGFGLEVLFRPLSVVGELLEEESVPWGSIEVTLGHLQALLAAIPEVPSASSSGPSVVAHPDFRVLIAEDNAGNREILQYVMEQIGCAYFMVQSGAAVLEEIGKGYELLLLDIQMPGADGVEVLKRIRQRKELKSLKILMVSASTLQSQIDQCLALGCDDFIPKPYRIEDLVQKIRDFIHQKHRLV